LIQARRKIRIEILRDLFAISLLLAGLVVLPDLLGRRFVKST
jgi:hypothetical protein